MTKYLIEYGQGKEWLSEVSGAPEDLLHTHVGLLIFVSTALLFRRRMRSLIPVGLVWFFAAGNEVLDILRPGPPISYSEHWLDILNTVFWPSLLFLIARRGTKVNDPSRSV